MATTNEGQMTKLYTKLPKISLSQKN